MNADIRNANGEPVVKIIDNEWRTDKANWDVEAVGKTLTFRDGKGMITLKMRSLPREALIIDKMDMMTHGFRLTCDGKTFLVTHPNGESFSVSGNRIESCRVGIEINMKTIGCGAGVKQGGNASFIDLKHNTTQLPIELIKAREKFNRASPPDTRRKIGRNSPCPCESGKKFKKCCGRPGTTF